MNNIPFNGRIAIIDDQLNQALPLINVLSQYQRPVTYYSGEFKFLPSQGTQLNDIRILFLDINLIDDSEHEDKVLKAKLVPVLKSVISENNFPYVIIYWSREDKKSNHPDKYRNLVEEIFASDLQDRKPIDFLSADKIQFFTFDGSKTDDIDEKIGGLFEKVNELIKNLPSYNCLLNWENTVHHSADKTLQDIFSSYHSSNYWAQNANFLINKLGESYAGRVNYKSQDISKRLISSFQAFNGVFIDSLEYSVSNQTFTLSKELEFDPELINSNAIFKINKRLLLSDDKEPFEYSGAVTEDLNPKSDKVFDEVLNNIFDHKKVEQNIRSNVENEGKTKSAIDKLTSAKRKQIRQSRKKIYFVITPLCDYIQSKYYNTKVVKGLLLKSEFLDCIDNKSEAIFISPKFYFENEIYVIVLHFRYFFTSPGSKGVQNLNSLFRVRQQLLSEIQSKLARHISRQGVLYLE